MSASYVLSFYPVTRNGIGGGNATRWQRNRKWRLPPSLTRIFNRKQSRNCTRSSFLRERLDVSTVTAKSSRLSSEFVTLFCECRTFVCLVKSNILVPGLVRNTNKEFASGEYTFIIAFCVMNKVVQGWNQYTS